MLDKTYTGKKRNRLVRQFVSVSEIHATIAKKRERRDGDAGEVTGEDGKQRRFLLEGWRSKVTDRKPPRVLFPSTTKVFPVAGISFVLDRRNQRENRRII